MVPSREAQESIYGSDRKSRSELSSTPVTLLPGSKKVESFPRRSSQAHERAGHTSSPSASPQQLCDPQPQREFEARRHREQQAKGESLIPDPTDKEHPPVKDIWRQSQAEELGHFSGILGQPQLHADREGQGG